MPGCLLLQAFYKLFAGAKTAHVRGPRPTAQMARFASLAVIAIETPYRLPANIDFERIVRDTEGIIQKFCERPMKCLLGTCGTTSLSTSA